MFITLKDGTDIYYEWIHGRKDTTLVFLHGNNESSEKLAEQKNYFINNYNLLFLDTRGHGRSGFGTGEYSLKKLAEDLQEILEYLEIKEYILIGFSDGANIIMEYSCRYIDKNLKAIVLIGGNLKPKGLKTYIYLEIIFLYLYKYLFSSYKDRKIVGLMISKGSFDYKDLRKIKVPALVMAGSKDMIKYKETKRISDNLVNGKLEILKDENHFFVYEKSEMANKLIEKFIME